MPLFALFALLAGQESRPAAPLPPAPQTPTAIHAVWVDPKILVVDGNPAEWSARTAPPVVIERLDQFIDLGRPAGDLWSGPDDGSLRVWVGWNEQDLVLGGSVLDEVADYDPQRWYTGDSLELFLDTGPRAKDWGLGDWQIMLAPAWEERPWGVYLHGDHDRSASTSDGGFGGVEVASTPITGGYRFEARIPWRNLAGFAPKAGASLGFNFALCDRDARGVQESYATWTAQSDIAFYADRRADLELDPPTREAAGAPLSTGAATPVKLQWIGLVLLAVLYGVALTSRGIWRSSSARRIALWSASFVLIASGALALLARYAQQSEREMRRAELDLYADRFERLLATGALGHPEPDELRRTAETLLAGKPVTPFTDVRFRSLAPPEVALGPEQRTERRGIPYRPLVRADAPVGERFAGVTLAPGESMQLQLEKPATIDAVHLVTRVDDPRYLRAGSAQTEVLRIELLRGGEAVAPARGVRNRQDLHLDEDQHRDHPGLEPAFYLPGGRLGRVHGDGLLLELGAPAEVDRIVVRHVGSDRGYSVQLVGLSVRTTEPATAPPEGLRANSAGEWQWSGWRARIEAEVAPPGRAPKRAAPGQLERPLLLGGESVGAMFLRDTAPLERAGRWDWLPIAAAACLAPFLVALLAEWLSTRQHIRNKLAVGFAITSAVPLLALTLLLEASLSQEHSSFEDERVQTSLVRAEQDLERDQRELEREAGRLLQIAKLRWQLRGEFPTTGEQLASSSWWGEGDPGSIRVLMRVTPDGRWVRVGSGPGWSALPKTFTPTSGLWRPWGRLLVIGVAQTSSGAEQPMLALVAHEARVERAVAADPPSGRPSATEDAEIDLMGSGRDPAPTLDDLHARRGEVRRAVFAPDGELAGVLVGARRERGVPVLGDFSLTELLLAAGLTALFTAMLFAGILTGHLVGPIERLSGAVREGRGESIGIEARDEVGHLAGAIRAFAVELKSRVRQLETLRDAQEDLSSRLDLDATRIAVVEFFRTEGRATSAWVLWCGEPGEESRLFGVNGRSLPVPAGAPFLGRAADAGALLELDAASGLKDLTGDERALLGPVERVLALPLSAGREVRGAIVLGFAPGAEALDLAFLRAAAAQAAIALENARLYAQAVQDPLTGFLTEPGFRQRVTEEIQRAEGLAGEGDDLAGVLLVELRLTDLPANDAVAAARVREASRRVRAAMRGMAVFGRDGTSDLLVAIPWSGKKPSFDALERRIADQISGGPWPDGEAVRGLLVSHAAWPDDGPSVRFVLQVLAERLVHVQSVQPAATLDFLAKHLPTDFVAGAPAMIEVLETVRRIAEQDVTVLLSGETGTGKDRIAELLHRWSPRVEGSLVHIHCPSLSSALVEDELFGHEVGAFTGADSRRMGPFEYAAGGTVVLDEVAGLSSEGQVALLRLVETRAVLRLGSTQPVPVDVRIVATTSVDLAAEVERGRFRSDLYFRLNVAQIAIPPLRLCKPALPELVETAIRRFNATAARPVTGVAPEVLDRLYEHDWPGNLRELFNVLSRGLILAQGTELRPEHIDLEVESAESAQRGGVLQLNERQRQVMTTLLTGGRITSTEYADLLGVSSRTGLRDLLELVEQGYLSREGLKKGTRFRRTAKAWRP